MRGSLERSRDDRAHVQHDTLAADHDDRATPLSGTQLRNPGAIAAVVTQNGNAYTDGFVGSFWDPLWRYADDPSDANAAPLVEGLSLDPIRWQYVHGVADTTRLDPDAWLQNFNAVHRPGNVDVQLALFRDYRKNVELYPAVQQWFETSQVPLLAIWGRNDQIFDSAGALAFQRHLPQAEVHLVDGGHWLLESHLDVVAGYTRGFLGRVLAETS